jgi:ferrochelatase
MTTIRKTQYDAVLVVAFGGPEKPEDVRPFLTRVTRGRVPLERLEAVAHHYDIFGGKSPVNEVTCNQAKALRKALANMGVSLPVYVGMRNWHPLLDDVVVQMKNDGIKRVAVVIMSVFQSNSSWDQYQTEVDRAVEKAGGDMALVYSRPVFDHPGFFKTVSKLVMEAMNGIPQAERHAACVLFTVHSLPHSDPGIDLYVEQIKRSAQLTANALHHEIWHIAYQSRSGRPQDPWLEPDINDVLKNMVKRGVKHVVVVPIGFVCDNVEVLYDLDTQARQTAKEAGIAFFLAKTVSDDSNFINALAELVLETERS